MYAIRSYYVPFDGIVDNIDTKGKKTTVTLASETGEKVEREIATSTLNVDKSYNFV